MTAPCKILLTVLVCALSAPGAMGQVTFDLPRWVFAGGGGTSTGDGFALRGTVGQANAYDLTDGPVLTMAAGFWTSMLMVGPRLTAELDVAASEIKISWPLPDDGFILQQHSILTPSGQPWQDIPPASYQTDGNTRFIIVPSFVPGVQYFRLYQP